MFASLTTGLRGRDDAVLPPEHPDRGLAGPGGRLRVPREGHAYLPVLDLLKAYFKIKAPVRYLRR
jgi:hypothetical protein